MTSIGLPPPSKMDCFALPCWSLASSRCSDKIRFSRRSRKSGASPRPSSYQLRGIQLINRRKQACFFLFSIGARRTHHASEAVSRLRSEAEHPQGLALTRVSGVVSSERPMEDRCHRHVLARRVTDTGCMSVPVKGAVHDRCAVGTLPTRDPNATRAGVVAHASTPWPGAQYGRCLWPRAQRLPRFLPAPRDERGSRKERADRPVRP